MGYVIVYGQCVNCGRMIAFNPNKVPSLVIEGQREPLCAVCFAKWNEVHRTSKGLDPIPLQPDAYEPEPEENL